MSEFSKSVALFEHMVVLMNQVYREVEKIKTLTTELELMDKLIEAPPFFKKKVKLSKQEKFAELCHYSDQSDVLIGQVAKLFGQIAKLVKELKAIDYDTMVDIDEIVVQQHFVALEMNLTAYHELSQSMTGDIRRLRQLIEDMKKPVLQALVDETNENDGSYIVKN